MQKKLREYDDLREFLVELQKRYNILTERKAKYGDVEAPFKLLNQIDDFEQAIASTKWAIEHDISPHVLENELKSLILEIDAVVFVDRRTEPFTGENPYRGLKKFTEDDHEFFFGRTEAVKELADISLKILDAKAGTQTPHLLTVLGPSGCGKSSLVRAGLIPALRQGRMSGAAGSINNSDWFIKVMVPGPHPLQTLGQQFDQLTEQSLAALITELRSKPKTLHELIQNFLATQRDGTALALVIDQVEELFTHCNDEAERRAFIDQILYEAQHTQNRSLIILTMRADFLGKVASYPNLAKAITANLTLVSPMNERELREAILRPAEKVHLEFERDLALALIQDSAGEPGALPLLQHALLELFHQRRDNKLLTMEAYEKIGGIKGALAQRADKLLAGLNDEQQLIARNIFLRLTTLGEEVSQSRRRVARDELSLIGVDPDQIDFVLQELSGDEARLIVTQEHSVEVTHEALIMQWETLQEWLDQDRAALRLAEDVRRAALEWEQNSHHEEYLDHKGNRLAKAKALADHPRITLNAFELSYIEACSTLYVDTKRMGPEAVTEAAQNSWSRYESGISPEYLQLRLLKRTGDGYPIKIIAGDGSKFPDCYLSPNILPWQSGLSNEEDGKRLFDWLFAHKALREAWGNMMRQSQLRLVRLWIDPDASELQALPWELLRDSGDDTVFPSLAASIATPFARFLPGPWQPGGPILTRPIKILAAIPGRHRPNNDQTFSLDTKTEQALLQQSLASLDINLTFAPQPCTLSALQQELKQGYHILHFIGRAKYDEQSRTTSLGLASADNLDKWVTVTDMASMLLSHSSELEDRWEAQLRLIVLTTDRDRESSSTTMAFQFCATQLIANGIPAVLTVSHKLPDGPAREFFHTFYQQLIEYGRVDLAANLARTNLLQTQLIDNELPMVYTRLRSGMLFGPKRSVSDLTSKL